jgi:Na+/proline symporter
MQSYKIIINYQLSIINYFVTLPTVMWIIVIICIYFAALMLISRLTQRRADNQTFFRAERRSPWYMVAFGMVGASISGVTFVSVPGMVLSSQMTYLQVCLGFIVGYLAVAFVLLPVYYRLNLTSIYMYLGQRLGHYSYQTGAWFFLLSKMVGAAIKFYVVCMVLQKFVFDALDVPFVVSVLMLVLLIWLYTRKGGVRTLVFTDVFQTLCLFTALLLIIYMVMRQMDFSFSDMLNAVYTDGRSRIFEFDDWASPQYFWKQFLSGVFIVIVMTGLDQDMMQKNLTCRTLHEAQKDMCSYGVAFVPANLLFLSLGVLLAMYFGPEAAQMKGDTLLPTFIQATSTIHYSLFTIHLFVIGIVAASFSSADSALTSLTTSYCVDIRRKPDDERLRKRTHLAMCLFFVLFILLFRSLSSTSLIDAIYTLAGYTYGPLLGLFAFGLFTSRRPDDRWVPYVCIASPLLCYALDAATQHLWAYRFGYELLMLNGLLTFAGLWLTQNSRNTPPKTARNTEMK